MAPPTPRTACVNYRRRLLNFTTSALESFDFARASCRNLVRTINENPRVDEVGFLEHGRELFGTLETCVKGDLKQLMERISSALLMLQPLVEGSVQEEESKADVGAVAVGAEGDDFDELFPEENPMLQRYLQEQVEIVASLQGVVTVREPFPSPPETASLNLDDNSSREASLSCSEATSKRLDLKQQRDEDSYSVQTTCEEVGELEELGREVIDAGLEENHEEEGVESHAGGKTVDTGDVEEMMLEGQEESPTDVRRLLAQERQNVPSNLAKDGNKRAQEELQDVQQEPHPDERPNRPDEDQVVYTQQAEGLKDQVQGGFRPDELMLEVPAAVDDVNKEKPVEDGEETETPLPEVKIKEENEEELDDEDSALEAQVLLAALDELSDLEDETEQSSSPVEEKSCSAPTADEEKVGHEDDEEEGTDSSDSSAESLADEERAAALKKACEENLVSVRMPQLSRKVTEQLEENEGTLDLLNCQELLGEQQKNRSSAEDKEEAEIRRLLRPLKLQRFKGRDKHQEAESSAEDQDDAERGFKRAESHTSWYNSSSGTSGDDNSSEDGSSSSGGSKHPRSSSAASVGSSLPSYAESVASSHDSDFERVREMLDDMSDEEDAESEALAKVKQEVSEEQDETRNQVITAEANKDRSKTDDAPPVHQDDAVDRENEDRPSSALVSPPAKKPRTDAAQLVDQVLAELVRTEDLSSQASAVIDLATPEEGTQCRSPLTPLNQNKNARKRRAVTRKRSRFIPSSSSSSDEENQAPKRRKAGKKKKGEEVVDVDSDSDFFIPEKKPRRRKKKERITIFLSDSAEDSDAESTALAGSVVVKEENKDVEDADVQQSSQASAGAKRKNIKKIIADKDLSKQTKDVMREERERVKRLEAKEKALEGIDGFSASSDDQEEVGNGDAAVDKLAKKFVLDVDPETKKPTVVVHKKLNKILKPHQRKGIKFMFDTAVESLKQVEKGDVGSGAILAHCMGLGKTLQVITLVHTLVSHDFGFKKFLILCPKNTLLNWAHEFNMWLDKEDLSDQIRVFKLEDGSKQPAKVKRVKEWHDSGGVFIMSYSEFGPMATPDHKTWKIHQEALQECLINPGPDFVVCDEGHLLKNEKTMCFRALQPMRTRRRMVLTGTPLQNNLIEYFNMVQLVKPSLLGRKDEFMNRFGNPINNGSLKDSTPNDVSIMRRRTFVLHKKLEPIVQRQSHTVLLPYLPNKLEYVVKVKLSPIQAQLYRAFLGQVHDEGTNLRQRMLADFQHVFTRVWNHPALLTMMSDTDKKKAKAAEAMRLQDAALDALDPSIAGISNNGEEGGAPDELTERYDENGWWKRCLADVDNINKIEHSSKFMLLLDILMHCQNLGEKLVIFSTSRLTLDAVEMTLREVARLREEKLEDGAEPFRGRTNFLTAEKPARWENYVVEMGTWRPRKDYLRIDGSVSSRERDQIRDVFNNPASPARLLLVTTKAGGIGVNLVGANRAIIMDVNWNPSNDVQALFRIFRLGQKKEVFVYRLVAGGCMEDKIYSRCVSKLSLSGRVVDEHQIRRHFTSRDLQELYNFELPLSLAESDEMADFPKDKLLAEILLQRKDWITDYHDHDSLLENRADECLDDEEKKKAWDEYEKDHYGGNVAKLHFPISEHGPLIPTSSAGEEEGDGNAAVVTPCNCVKCTGPRYRSDSRGNGSPPRGLVGVHSTLSLAKFDGQSPYFTSASEEDDDPSIEATRQSWLSSQR